MGAGTGSAAGPYTPTDTGRRVASPPSRAAGRPHRLPSALTRYRAVRVGLAGTDALGIVAALLAVHATGLLGASEAGALGLVVALAPVAWVAVFGSFDLYGIHHLSGWEEFRRIISACTVGTFVVIVASFWWSPPSVRGTLGWTWLLALVLELATRRAWRWHLYRRRVNGSLALRTIVVGDGEASSRLAPLLDEPEHGFHPIGFVSTTPNGHGSARLPCLGTVADLRQLVRSQQAECVFVSSTDSSAMADVFRVARQEDVLVKVAANVPDLLTSRLLVQPVGKVATISVKQARLTPVQAAIKRGFDIAVAAVGLLLTLPLMALIALAVRVTSPGPVLFRQDRVTKGGRIFSICKFRTMLREVDRLDGPIVELTKPFFKQFDDPRLTRVGRFLRRYSLDELPQLWNVLRGDISLVGPRPLPAIQMAGNQRFSSRHEVQAGLTGWWQVNGRSCVDAEEALQMDLFYIENWSLTLDIYILLKTVGTVVSGRGAC